MAHQFTGLGNGEKLKGFVQVFLLQIPTKEKTCKMSGVQRNRFFSQLTEKVETQQLGQAGKCFSIPEHIETRGFIGKANSRNAILLRKVDSEIEDLGQYVEMLVAIQMTDADAVARDFFNLGL